MNTPATNGDGLASIAHLINTMPGNHLVLLPDSPTFTIVAVSDDYLSALNLNRESVLGSFTFTTVQPGYALQIR